jgi:hypothetical protein
LSPTALSLGLLGLLLELLALLSSFPELRLQEALLVFVPTDLLLPVFDETWRRRYLSARLVGLGLVGLGHLGWLIQPLAPVALAALPLLSARFSARARYTRAR